VDDPDAPSHTWVHWVLYDLPASVRELPEAVPAAKVLDNGASQGVNDFGNVGYGGPCPPRGPQHRYVFNLYALSRMTGLRPESTKKQLLSAMSGHILAQAQLTGVYQR
jgi:Raf kinase inhibitor-like YbhB/YbcL family protein